MSACLTCPRPGVCCQDFNLSSSRGPLTFWKRDGIAGPLEFVARAGLPFVPLSPNNEDWQDAESGRLYGTWRWGCSNLERGRCADWPNRPSTCRDYAPLQDRLCALHPSRLLGCRQ